MITNDRQYKISKGILSQLSEAIKNFDMKVAIDECGGEKVLAEAQLRAIESEYEVISEQLKEYEALRAGTIESFEANSLHDLYLLLIKARIAKGLSQRDLAEKLGMKEQQIQRYEADKYSSASLHRLIEISDCLGLKINKKARLEIEASSCRAAEKPSEIEWSKFPIKEIYRRKWFTDFTGDFRGVELNAELLLKNFTSIVGNQTLRALHRKHFRMGSEPNEYSLFAWQCRILNLAKAEKVESSFKKSYITNDWIKSLVKLSNDANGPRLSKDHLREIGISLIIEPHLSKTYLDGAALLLSRDNPVIGMTLRYDRLDNFWFVLFHELAHLILHMNKDDVQFFDDLDSQPDEIEKEADEYASNLFIPKEIWETCVARYLQTPETVIEAAKQFEVSPAIVAGRIRNESQNFVILNELIGIGKVRNQFSEIQFGV